MRDSRKRSKSFVVHKQDEELYVTGVSFYETGREHREQCGVPRLDAQDPHVRFAGIAFRWKMWRMCTRYASGLSVGIPDRPESRPKPS